MDMKENVTPFKYEIKPYLKKSPHTEENFKKSGLGGQCARDTAMCGGWTAVKWGYVQDEGDLELKWLNNQIEQLKLKIYGKHWVIK